MSNSDPTHPWQSSSKRMSEAFTLNLGARKKFAAKSRTWDENQVSSPIEYAPPMRPPGSNASSASRQGRHKTPEAWLDCLRPASRDAVTSRWVDEFRDHPLGEAAEREPQIIPKTDECSTASNSGASKNSAFLEGNKLEVAIKDGRVLTHLWAGRRS